MANHSPTPGYLDILYACHLIAFEGIDDDARERWEKDRREALRARGRPELANGQRASLRLQWAARKIERAGREGRLETLVREFQDSTAVPRRNVGAQDCWFDRRIDLTGDRMRGSLALKPKNGGTTSDWLDRRLFTARLMATLSIAVRSTISLAVRPGYRPSTASIRHSVTLISYLSR